MASAYKYDAAGRLAEVAHRKDGLLLASFQYGYDALGSRSVVTETLNGGTSQVVIDYDYDPLARLTDADYSDGRYFHYEHDAAGNRLEQEVTGGAVMTYTYDLANRLIEAGGVGYTWDDNGNLRNDGVYTYTYSSANRLIEVSSEQATVSSFAYNGLGDRVQQMTGGDTVTYVLDTAVGLTQVLADNNFAYLYGLGRIAQQGASSTGYFLGDALGSVRQWVNGGHSVTKGCLFRAKRWRVCYNICGGKDGIHFCSADWAG